jgi:membrane associated rhomboid family serine protease
MGDRSWYQRPIGAPSGSLDSPHMKKSVAVFALWFYAGWAFWALIAGLFNQNALIGPVVGLVLAIIVVSPQRARPTSRT